MAQSGTWPMSTGLHVLIVARDPERSLFGKGSQCYATICERPTAVVGVLRSGPDRARCRDLHPCRVVLRRAGCLRRRGRRKRGRWWRSRARSTRHSAAPATDRARFNNGTDLPATRSGTWWRLRLGAVCRRSGIRSAARFLRSRSGPGSTEGTSPNRMLATSGRLRRASSAGGNASYPGDARGNA